LFANPREQLRLLLTSREPPVHDAIAARSPRSQIDSLHAIGIAPALATLIGVAEIVTTGEYLMDLLNICSPI